MSSLAAALQFPAAARWPASGAKTLNPGCPGVRVTGSMTPTSAHGLGRSSSDVSESPRRCMRAAGTCP